MSLLRSNSPLGSGLLLCLPLGLAFGLACSNSTSISGLGAVTSSGPVEVSGTVAYPGAHTGPIYVLLQSQAGANSYGATLAAPGAFTIHGVPTGSYTLSATLDVVGNGAPNANDPASSTAVTVTVAGTPVTGLGLTLADPSVTLTNGNGPAFTVQPMASGAVVAYTPLTTTLANSSLTADTTLGYTVEWSATSAFTAIAGSRTVPPGANGNNLIFLTDPSLANGGVFFFRMRGANAATTTNNNAQTAGVTIGAPSAGNTVTGTVTFTGTATGPLYVYCQNGAGTAYATVLPNPVSPQAFSLPGVPSGIFQVKALVDQNGNGVIDAGDLANAQAWTLPVTVSASLAPQALTLPSGNANVLLTTFHDQTFGVDDDYQLNLQLTDLGRHITAVTLASGPDGFTGPVDLGNAGAGFNLNVDLGSTLPVAGQTFAATVTYSDGTTASLAPAVTGVVASMPQNEAPTGIGDGSGKGSDVSPVFSWTAPATPPSTYAYAFSLWSNALDLGWSTGWLPSTTNQLTFGTDPSNPGNTSGTLVPDYSYSWGIIEADNLGNQGMNTVTYTP